MHYAAFKGHELVVEHLVKYGADINSIAKVSCFAQYTAHKFEIINTCTYISLFVLSFMHLKLISYSGKILKSDIFMIFKVLVLLQKFYPPVFCE